MKSVTLTMHELRLFTSFFSPVPEYIANQLGDYSKREIQVKEADRKRVLADIESGLAATGCKARTRRLSNLRDTLNG